MSELRPVEVRRFPDAIEIEADIWFPDWDREGTLYEDARHLNQWDQTGTGLSKVVPLFAEAGGWSALQFLIDADPNLGVTPIEALWANRVNAVVDAARLPLS